ncbi:hypothetical protein ACIOJE_07730 [Kitasatospora sp. NPDC087861]
MIEPEAERSSAEVDRLVDLVTAFEEFAADPETVILLRVAADSAE